MTQRRAIIIGLGIPVGFLVAILVWGTLQTGGEQGRPGVNSSFGEVAVSTDPHSDFVLPLLDGGEISLDRSAREDRGGGLLGVVVPTVQGRGAGVGRGVPGLAGTRGRVRGDRAMGRRTIPSANSSPQTTSNTSSESTKGAASGSILALKACRRSSS